MKQPPAEPYPVRSVETIEVVRTETLSGEGIKGNPYRIVEQYWLDGRELTKKDFWADQRDERAKP